MRNLELKVACDAGSLADIRTRLAAVRPTLAAPERLRQIDTYFRVPHGRLKLRRIWREDDVGPATEAAELIGYDRADRDGSRWSSYHIAPLDPATAGEVHDALALSLGVLVRIDKRREVVIVGKTRVHLDEVDGLGAFVELETVIDGQDDAAAEKEHRDVIAMLGLGRYPPVAGSYSDLLLGKSTSNCTPSQRWDG